MVQLPEGQRKLIQAQSRLHNNSAPGLLRRRRSAYVAQQGGGAADRGEYCEAAGVANPIIVRRRDRLTALTNCESR